MNDHMLPTHVFPLRVYYEDTDAGRVVYYANYLRFAERGRTEYLRSIGTDHCRLKTENDMAFMVRQCSIDYISPAFLDDVLEVHSRFLEVMGASLRVEQVVKREAKDLARLIVLLACVGGDGQPKRMPAKLRRALVAGVKSEN